MGQENRDYWRSDSGGLGGGAYLSNPGAILSFAMPFGTWWGARVRLHFWLLLSFLFMAVGSIESGRLIMLPITLGLVLTALMLHEFGHRWAAEWFGGSHDEFVLWPVGGMVPAQAPPRPGAMFVVHGAGLAVNLVLAFLCAAGLLAVSGGVKVSVLGFFGLFGGGVSPFVGDSMAAMCLGVFLNINLGIAVGNLLPYYWFDGGYLLQAIVWRWTGLHRAVNVTCIVGMVLATPMFLLALMGGSFMGMVLWALLFSSAYTRRKQLQTQGTNELEDAIAFSAAMRPDGQKKARWGRWNRAAAAAKEAARERRDQEQVDAILAQVHEKGMNSLSWWQRRTLKKATERQRQREAARNRRTIPQ